MRHPVVQVILLEKLVRVALPRIRDFKGIESKFDGKGNYTLGDVYKRQVLEEVKGRADLI